MRRPLALWGFTFLGCSLYYTVFGGVATHLLLIAAFAGTIACLLFYSTLKQHPIGWSVANVLLAVLFSGTLIVCAVETTISPVEAYFGKEESIRMTILEDRGQYDRIGYYTATTDSLGHRSLRLQLQVQGDSRYQVGDVIEGKVQLEQPSSLQEKRLLSERIALKAKTDAQQPLAVVDEERNIYYYAAQVKRVLYKNIHAVLPQQTANMVAGICLGETGDLPQSVITQFQTCGMSHMTAVSGLHTTTLVGFLVALFVSLRWNRRWANLLGVVPVWMFVFVVGVPASAVRAGIMFTLVAVASRFRYASDSLNNLGGAVLAILLISPFAAGDIGFMASVSACLGLIVYSEPCGKLLRRAVPRQMRENPIVGFVTNGLGITLSASTASLFCILLGFYRFSLVAPITNLIGVPVAGVILVCSLIGSILMTVPGLSFCGGLLLVVGGWLADGLMLLARVGASIPYASLPYASGWCMLAVLLFFVGGTLTYRYRKRLRRSVKGLIAVGLVVLLLVAPWMPIYGADTYEVIVIGSPVDPTIAVIGSNTCVVIGCSSPYLLHSLLSSRQAETIDCLILPTCTTYGDSLRQLWDVMPIGKITTSAENLQQGLIAFADTQRISNECTVLAGGVTVTMDEAFTSFTIIVGGERLVYETKQETAFTQATVITQTQTSRFTLMTHRNVTYVVNDVLVLNINDERVRIYRPRYLYG